MTETELHLLKMQAKCNVTTINYVMHIGDMPSISLAEGLNEKKTCTKMNLVISFSILDRF
ncbi:hypothetical protein L208DRAFT_1332645 [Tricholoma matsutake]|nr:hypothetical protein L208DRAFT_1332645 [Tricholoma matsutake 945]